MSVSDRGTSTEPAPVECKAFYGSLKKVFPEGAEAHLKVRWERLRALLPPLEGKRVLDVGCAEGRLTQKIAQHGAARVVGVEKRGDRVNWAQQEMPEVRDGRLAFYHGKAQDLCDLAAAQPADFASKFDVVLCMDVLHHIAHRNKGAAVRSVCRQSQDLLIIIVPFADTLRDRLFSRKPAFNWLKRVVLAEGFELLDRQGTVTRFRRRSG